MDRLYPQHVPVYETDAERERLWERCHDRGDPVIAVRAARRGFVVKYDLGHLDSKLTGQALRQLRQQTAAFRSYPTGDTDSFPHGADPLSQAERLGGEAGPVSGDLHAPTEAKARDLASRLSAVVFDGANRLPR
jgi:hypothetical protein